MSEVMEDKTIKRQCLNVGSGVDYKASNASEEWTNVDMNPRVEPDVVCAAEDLDKHFGADTFDEVHLIHVWEHCEDLIKVMEQIWRVMKAGGKLVVICPYWTAENAFADPTHRHCITRITYGFLSYHVYQANAAMGTRMSQLFPECDFDIEKMHGVPMDGKEKYKDQEFAVKHYMNVLEELQVELRCVKPIRTFDIREFQNRGTSRPGA